MLPKARTSHLPYIQPCYSMSPSPYTTSGDEQYSGCAGGEGGDALDDEEAESCDKYDSLRPRFLCRCSWRWVEMTGPSFDSLKEDDDDADDATYERRRCRDSRRRSDSLRVDP